MPWLEINSCHARIGLVEINNGNARINAPIQHAHATAGNFAYNNFVTIGIS